MIWIFVVADRVYNLRLLEFRLFVDAIDCHFGAHINTKIEFITIESRKLDVLDEAYLRKD
jgi:hypothetical protein